MISKTLRMSIVVLIGLAFACNNQETRKEDNKPNLDELESKAFSSSDLDIELGKELLRAYRYELNQQLDPEMLFKAGEVAYNLPDHEDVAMEYFQRLVIKYPRHERAPYAVFYRGLIYDNRWNDKEKSAEVWEDFLVQYPSHELANDAADLLPLARDTTDDLEKVLRWQQESKPDIQ